MNQKFTKRLLLAAIMMVVGAGNLWAADGDLLYYKTIEGVWVTFKVIDEEHRYCTVGNGVDACISQTLTGTVTIPKQLNDYYFVTEINKQAFMNCKVKEVVIPQSVDYINTKAFYGCENLQRCWLPEYVHYVNSYTFYGCKNLTDVYLPHWQLWSIGESAFEGCESLKSIVFPKTLQQVYPSAFKDCKKLENIVFLGKDCPCFHDSGTFEGTPYVDYDGTKYSAVNVSVPVYNDSWANELAKQFDHCDEGPAFGPLTGQVIRAREIVNLMPSIMSAIWIRTYDDTYKIYECDYLGTEEKAGEEFTTFTLPEKILDFQVISLERAVRGEGSMEYVKKAVIPGTCKSIGTSSYMPRSGFAGCPALEEVDIQEGVRDIGYGVFDNTALKELHFPKSLKTYYSAVHDCPNLTDVYFHVRKLDYFGTAFESPYSHSQATLHVPYGTSENYLALVPNEFAKIEEMDLHDGDIFAYPHKTGKDMLFQIISMADKTCRVYGENLLTPSIDTNTEGTVNIPNKPLGYKVVEVGDYAFTMCKKLTFVSIPNTVERIGIWALAGCDEMVSANIPPSVKVIDEYALQANNKLVNVFLSEGLEQIRDHGFAFCPALESIILPQSLTYLGNWAFQGSVLTSIEIPSSVKRIYEYSFQNSKKLESVLFNEGLQEIRRYAFNGCESLTSIELPQSVNMLYKGAFKNCLNLSDVKINNSHIQLVDNWGDPVDNNEAFDLKTDRYAELTVPENTNETYNKDPWSLWFNKITYSLPNIPTGIEAIQNHESEAGSWYTIDGYRLNGQPTKSGLYIRNGKKVVVR